jgi:hypothetical protein
MCIVCMWLLATLLLGWFQWGPPCRSGFTTLSPVSLQEQSAMVLCWRGLDSHNVSAIKEHSGHEDLISSGRQSVISYVHERMRVVLQCSIQALASL